MFTRLLFVFLFTASYWLMNAQCYPDRHNTTWYDGWISCEASENPNPDRGESHWIHISTWAIPITWDKCMSGIPMLLITSTDGIQSAAIDISVDGINWIELGEFDFEQGNGKINL
jgi:hypothetical protein